MGAVLTILAEAVEIAETTGFAFESIISGEIGAAYAAEVGSLILVEGYELTEALQALSIEPTLYSFLTEAPVVLNNYIYGSIAASSAAGIASTGGLYASYLQTKSGLSNLHNFNRPFPIWVSEDTRMALQLWRPDYLAEFVPGYRSFEYFVGVVTGWTGEALTSVSQLLWRAIQQETTREIARVGRDLVTDTSQRALSALAQVIQTARFAVVEGPSNLYAALREYYTNTRLSAPQLRDIQNRLRTRYGLPRDAFSTGDASTDFQEPLSGQYAERYSAPGGTTQLVAADWLLLLLLGLLGQRSPHIIEEFEEEEAFLEDEED